MIKHPENRPVSYTATRLLAVCGGDIAIPDMNDEEEDERRWSHREAFQITPQCFGRRVSRNRTRGTSATR